MKGISIATMLLGLLASCAVESNPPTTEASDGDPQGTVEGAARIDPRMPVMTWQILLSQESCFDDFGRSCTSSFPSPQCPSGTTNGSPCFVSSGTVCYQTISPGNFFNAYQCF